MCKISVHRKILTAMADSEKIYSVDDIRRTLPSTKPSTIHTMLNKLARTGHIARVSRGRYKTRHAKPKAMTPDRFWDWFDKGMRA